MSYITPFLLNQSLLKIAQKCKKRVRNYQKVIKSSFRDVTNYFGFLKYNPAIELQIPKVFSLETKNGIKHIYSQEEINKILLRFKNNNRTAYSKIKDDKGRWFLRTTKTNWCCREIFICGTLYKILVNYKEEQRLLKKKYGRKYKKYELDLFKNKYGKIIEYKIVENRHKSSNSVEMVFTKIMLYVVTDIIKYPFKIIHNELGVKKCKF